VQKSIHGVAFSPICLFSERAIFKRAGAPVTKESEKAFRLLKRKIASAANLYPPLCSCDGMNPFFVGVFDHSDDEPLPVIRMVFALSSAKPGVTIMEPEGSRKAKETKAKKSPRYTSYDIWCAGAFAETFAVINEIEEEVYKQLLKVCNKFPQSYESNMVGVNHWGAFEVTEEGADEGMDEYDYED